MAYKITEKCTQCGTCKDSCPVDAIVERNGKFEVVSDDCVDCGTCESNCPANAVVAG
ncbi:MAG: 4Fe-4S binding protein [Oscillospiraceae bacterium]|jgi:MinD superfamily P-loop ATPase|nr:4Fe-4S binding protein [Oscillospiraceae bacterium]